MKKSSAEKSNSNYQRKKNETKNDLQKTHPWSSLLFQILDQLKNFYDRDEKENFTENYVFCLLKATIKGPSKLSSVWHFRITKTVQPKIKTFRKIACFVGSA